MATLEAGHAAVFGNLKPLVGVSLAIVLLDERLTGGQLIGGALVFTGVIIASSLTSGPALKTMSISNESHSYHAVARCLRLASIHCRRTSWHPMGSDVEPANRPHRHSDTRKGHCRGRFQMTLW
jgi:hypothetical protein